MGTIHRLPERHTLSAGACMVNASSNPFRGLLWGLLLSGMLWVGIFVLGERAIRWITSLI